MERLEFNDYEEFACEVADTFDDIRYDDDFNDIAIIAHYDDAKHIIREILSLGYDLNTIELNNPTSGYDDVPYIVSVCGIDSEHEVWCEPMIHDNGQYINDESSVIYVLDNCSSEVLKHLDSECIFEVEIEDDECSYGECECAYKKDEKPTTTTSSTASKSTYRVNSEEVDKDTYVNALRTIEDMYTKNISETLSAYSDIVDEMHKWKRLLGW